MISLLQPLNIPKTICNKQSTLNTRKFPDQYFTFNEMEKPKLTFTYSINLFEYAFALYGRYSTSTDRRTDEPTHLLNDCVYMTSSVLVLVLLLSDSIYWCSLWFTFCEMKSNSPLLLFCVLCTHCFWPFQMAWRDFYRLYFHSAVHSTPQPVLLRIVLRYPAWWHKRAPRILYLFYWK